MERILGFDESQGLFVRRGNQILKRLLFRQNREVVVLERLKTVLRPVMDRLLQVAESLIPVSL